jgi:hypothetical protein
LNTVERRNDVERISSRPFLVRTSKILALPWVKTLRRDLGTAIAQLSAPSMRTASRFAKEVKEKCGVKAKAWAQMLIAWPRKGLFDVIRISENRCE